MAQELGYDEDWQQQQITEFNVNAARYVWSD
jgi:hypothetical protein